MRRDRFQLPICIGGRQSCSRTCSGVATRTSRQRRARSASKPVGGFSHIDGLRDLRSHDYELRPTVEWKLGDHTLGLSLDARQIRQTPDSFG